MTSRRSIAERVIARATSRGVPIDGDVECMAIIELWVSGDIEAGEMRDRFNALLTRRCPPPSTIASAVPLWRF